MEPGGPGGKVIWREQRGDVLRLEVQTDRASFLVISNNFYPGWEAWVNGEPAAVYRTDYVAMGVAAPAGRSEVVLKFHTPGLRAGFLLTLLSLAIAAAMVALGGLDVRRSRSWAYGMRSVR